MEDVLDDPKLNALELADQMLFIRLLAVLNRQKSRDGIGHLDFFAATALARRHRWAYARSPFDHLAATGLVTITYRDGGIEYLIPKWAEIQGFTPTELRRDSGETPAPTPTPKTTPTPTPTPTNTKKVAARAAPRGGSRPTLAPESLPDEDRKKLRDWCIANSVRSDFIDHAWERVRDWSHTNGKKRRNWWVVCKNAIQDGWALKGQGNGSPPKSWAQQQEDATNKWLEEVSKRDDTRSDGPQRALPGVPVRRH